MSARAAAVILTDTKSLSRFSVMKFSSVNVQSSCVSRLSSPLKEHSCFYPESLSRQVCKASLILSLTCTFVRALKHIQACTQRQVTHTHTHTCRGINRESRRHTLGLLRSSLMRLFTVSHLDSFVRLCQQLRGREEAPRVQSDLESREWSFHPPREINILTERRCHILASKQH